MVTAFDTHATVKDLVNAGLTEAQAEALTRALQRGTERSDLATQADIATLRAEMKDMENRLIKWMVGIAIAIIGINLAALALFVRFIG